jgi:MFS family permease
MAPKFMVDLAPIRESRDFRYLFAGVSISTLGGQLTTVAIPFQTYSMTHSSFQVGLISFVQFVPLIFGSLLGGTIGDVVDRRTLLRYAGLASSVTAGLLAWNATLAHPSLFALYLISAVAAGLTGFSNPARNAAIPMLVKPSQLVAAYSFNQVSFQLAIVAGPAIAGLLLAKVGLAWTYGLDAASFVILFVALLFISPLPPADGAKRAGVGSIVEGFRYLRGRQVIQGVYLIDLNAMIFGMPRALFPAMAANIFHGGTATLGLLYSAPGFGALLGALTTGWVEVLKRRGRAVILAVVGWGVAITFFGFSRVLWISVVLLAIAGWCDVISAVLRNTILQSSIPDSFRSRLSSFQMAVVQGGPRVGDMESGAVAALTSTEFSVVSGGLACIIGAVILAKVLPGFWEERDQAPPTTVEEEVL